jgi:A/G-specific adenine glycosylase
LTEDNILIQSAKKRKKRFQRLVLKWIRSNLRDFPWRDNRDEYRVLIVEFLLKRTTATAVSRIYDEFLKRYPDLNSLAGADIGQLADFLKTIGYHKLRSKMLCETATHILENHAGIIPKSYDELLTIPNVGFYTAGAICSFGYDIPAAIVDSNIERILKRVFMETLPEKAVPRKLRAVADILVPSEEHALYNFGLLDLGAAICSYRWIRCEECPLRKICDTSLSSVPK